MKPFDEPVIDEKTWQDLNKLADFGGDTFLEELFASFWKQFPETMKMVRQGTMERNCVQVAYLAHQLRSSTASLGLSELRCYLEDIERHADDGNLSAALSLIEIVDRAFDAAKEEISKRMRIVGS